MSLSEGRKMLAHARRVGSEYVRKQLDEYTFQDHATDWVYREPASDLPRTQKEAMRVARHVLTDFRQELSHLHWRDVLGETGDLGFYNAYGDETMRRRYGVDTEDLRVEFFEGVDRVLETRTTTAWLAHEILFHVNQRLETVRAIPRWPSELNALVYDAVAGDWQARAVLLDWIEDHTGHRIDEQHLDDYLALHDAGQVA